MLDILARQVIADKEQRHAFVKANIEARQKHLEPKPRQIRSRSRRQKVKVEPSYEGLEGEWLEWLEVAKKYEHKVPSQDRYDMRHTIILELHRARQRDNKPLPPLRAYRIASLMVALYWRKEKLPTILSLDEPTTDYDGNECRLLDTVADDKAIDLDAWLDDKTFLLGCPMRLIEIATKINDGIPLATKDRMYLMRYRRQEQKRLL
ncbi:hypothetical protein ES703_02564 [subsurface metagenome]